MIALDKNGEELQTGDWVIKAPIDSWNRFRKAVVAEVRGQKSIVIMFGDDDSGKKYNRVSTDYVKIQPEDLI